MSIPASRLLVIDDDAVVLQVCAEVLHRQGHEVVAVQCGQEGLALVRRREFDLAVVDIVLPDVNGLTILKTIKQTDPDLVVLLMTGYASLDTAVQALRDGAYDYLRKPFDAEDLVRIVEQGLQERRLRLESRGQLAQLAGANQELVAEVQRVTKELSAFIRLGREGREGEAPAHMLEQVLRAAAQLTGAAQAGLLAQQADGRITCLAAEGPRAGELRRTELTSDHLLRQALQSGRPLISPRLLERTVVATCPLALAGFSSALIVPLPSTAPRPGALLLLDARDGFTERQAELAQALAGQVAVILAAATAAQRGRPTATAGPDDFVDLVDLLGGST